jgi:hypothetical protein
MLKDALADYDAFCASITSSSTSSIATFSTGTVIGSPSNTSP